MFDSPCHPPGGRVDVDRLLDDRVEHLQSELSRTKWELDVLRDTTAQVVTAILTELQARPVPVAEVPAEIQSLAALREPAKGELLEDPVTGKAGGIDLTRRDSLAHLDRRFRWIPARRPSE